MKTVHTDTHVIYFSLVAPVVNLLHVLSLRLSLSRGYALCLNGLPTVFY